MKIRVALVGYGLSGKLFHAPLLKALECFEVSAIVSSRKEEALTDFPKAQICSFEKALELSDLVVIATPHHLHFDQCMQALSHNKHVVVEKPFTATLEQAKNLFNIAEEKNLLLAVFHNRRYDADFLTIKSFIDNKAIGDIVTIESHFDRFRPSPKEGAWREKASLQSGVWWDLGPHLIDQAVQLMGIPNDIDFDIGVQRDGQADDFFDVTFKYEKGRRFHLRASCIVKDFGFRFRVHGTKGSALFEKLDVQEEQLRSGMSVNDPPFGVYPSSSFLLNSDVDVKVVNGNYLNFYKEVATCIKDNKKFSVSRDEVLFTTAVLLGNKSF